MAETKVYGEELEFDGGDLEITGDVNVDGFNVYLNATLGAERVIDGTFSVVGLGNWVLGAGWSDGTGKAAKAADGVGTLTQAVAIPAVVGTTYKIVYQVKDVTVDGVTLTYGGVSNATKLADGTYTFYVTATTTGSLILTPSSNGSRFSIDNVSVKALTDATGDLVVDGNLEVKSSATLRSGLNISNGQILLPNGTTAAPSLSFVNDSGTGFYYAGSGQVGMYGTLPNTHFILSNANNTLLYVGINSSNQGFVGTVANTKMSLRTNNVDNLQLSPNLLEMINSTNPQTFQIYETYTDANNYERYALIASGNQLEIKAETLGTGEDNLNIVLTPAGAGCVGIGTTPTASYTLHVKNASANSVPRFTLENDVVGYMFQINGADADQLQLLDTIGYDTFFETRRLVHAIFGVAGSCTTILRGAEIQVKNNTGGATPPFEVYSVYTSADNYERLKITGSTGVLSLTAETAGTGADNLDIALTPAGTGNVKFGTYAAITAETLQGFITIKDAAGNLRKVAVVA